MTLPLQDCRPLRGCGNSNTKDMMYKKLVDDDAAYISLIAHCPYYENSEFRYSGWCGLTKVITVDGQKKELSLTRLTAAKMQQKNRM